MAPWSLITFVKSSPTTSKIEDILQVTETSIVHTNKVIKPQIKVIIHFSKWVLFKVLNKLILCKKEPLIF